MTAGQQEAVRLSFAMKNNYIKAVEVGSMRTTDVLKSDIGAQAAWKGFTSQTMYIANRLVSDNDGYDY